MSGAILIDGADVVVTVGRTERGPAFGWFEFGS